MIVRDVLVYDVFRLVCWVFGIEVLLFLIFVKVRDKFELFFLVVLFFLRDCICRVCMNRELFIFFISFLKNNLCLFCFRSFWMFFLGFMIYWRVVVFNIWIFLIIV